MSHGGSRRRLSAAVAAGLLAAVCAAVGLGSPAAAHGQFVGSDPAPGSEVTEALETIFVYFTEKPTSNAYFAVTGPEDVRVDRLWSHGPTRPIAPPVHEWYRQADDRWVVRAYSTAYSAQIPIAYWPEVGEYKVQYVSVASDGQPVRGEFTFTYSGPVSELPPDFSPQRSEPDPNLLEIAPPGAPTAPPTGPPIEEVIAAEENAGPSLWILLIPVGIMLVVAAAALVFWRLRPQQARELMVSRFGGRYAAPSPRRSPPWVRPEGRQGPEAQSLASPVPSSVTQRLPARVRQRLSDAGEPPQTTPKSDE